MKVILVPHPCPEGNKQEYNVAYKAITLEGEEAIFYQDNPCKTETIIQQMVNEYDSNKTIKRQLLFPFLEISSL